MDDTDELGADAAGMVQGGWAKPSTYLQGLWTRYRMNNQGLEALWTKQNGCCPGCGGKLAHPLKKHWELAFKPVAEVDGMTGRVRGFLCKRCYGLLKTLSGNEVIVGNLLRYSKGE